MRGVPETELVWPASEPCDTNVGYLIIEYADIVRTFESRCGYAETEALLACISAPTPDLTDVDTFEIRNVKGRAAFRARRLPECHDLWYRDY